MKTTPYLAIISLGLISTVFHLQKFESNTIGSAVKNAYALNALIFSHVGWKPTTKKESLLKKICPRMCKNPVSSRY